MSFEGILDHRHHAQAEQVHFDDAHVGAIFFIPLHHHAAGHGGGFERHHGIELALADHHAAGVLAEMARQILHGQVQLEKFAHARMLEIEAGIAEFALGCVVLVAAFPGGDGGRDLASVSGSKPSALPTSRAAERPR